jgi:hypothetical protein
MEDIVLESKLNYHSIEELETFNSKTLNRIKSIRDSKDIKFKNILNEMFDNFELFYPEIYFIGIHKIYSGREVSWFYKRTIKNITKYFYFKKREDVVKHAKKYAKKHDLKLYKGTYKTKSKNERNS